MVFEPGQKIYVLSANGAVVSGDFPRCHVEFRKVICTCTDAQGHDADRLEFKFLDCSNQISVAGHRLSVPPTCMIISHVSGAVGARVEAQDQILQFSQLARQRRGWFDDSVDMEPLAVEPAALPTLSEGQGWIHAKLMFTWWWNLSSAVL